MPNQKQAINFISELNKATLDIQEHLKCYKLDIALQLELIL